MTSFSPDSSISKRPESPDSSKQSIQPPLNSSLPTTRQYGATTDHSTSTTTRNRSHCTPSPLNHPPRPRLLPLRPPHLTLPITPPPRHHLRLPKPKLRPTPLRNTLSPRLSRALPHAQILRRLGHHAAQSSHHPVPGHADTGRRSHRCRQHDIPAEFAEWETAAVWDEYGLYWDPGGDFKECGCGNCQGDGGEEGNGCWGWGDV